MSPGYRQHLVDRVDGAEAGRACCRDDRADPAASQQGVQCSDVDPPGCVGADRSALDTENAAHPAVRVVRLGAVGDAATRMRFPGHIQRLKVRDRSASGEVPEVLAEAEHPGQLTDNLLLHGGRRGPAVERVVVRVDQHGGEIASHRGRMRRLEHLPCVGRVEERVVVLQPSRKLGECVIEPLVTDLQRVMNSKAAESVLPALVGLSRLGQPALQIHSSPPDRCRQRGRGRDR